MAGVVGLEPTVHWTKTSCLTTLATPQQGETFYCFLSILSRGILHFFSHFFWNHCGLDSIDIYNYIHFIQIMTNKILFAQLYFTVKIVVLIS